MTASSPRLLSQESEPEIPFVLLALQSVLRLPPLPLHPLWHPNPPRSQPQPPACFHSAIQNPCRPVVPHSLPNPTFLVLSLLRLAIIRSLACSVLVPRLLYLLHHPSCLVLRMFRLAILRNLPNPALLVFYLPRLTVLRNIHRPAPLCSAEGWRNPPWVLP